MKIIANLAILTILFHNLDGLKTEERSWLGDRSVNSEKRSQDDLVESFEEPVPQVSGLLRRVKRFECWHNCLAPAQPYQKQDKDNCEEGGSCTCLLDLLGQVHGISCLATGRRPLEYGQTPPPETEIMDEPMREKKFQCNYKTCWTVEEDEHTKKKNEGKKLIYKLATVTKGTYSKGKCNCGQKRILPLENVRPAALNHVHQKEDYKFALSFKTFPDSEGNCACRFGKSINEPGPGGVRSLSESEESQSFSAETGGIRNPDDMEELEHDKTRDIVQCGLTGCHHVIVTIPKVGEQDEENSSPKSKPWYMWELTKKRDRPQHRHDTATSVICNLKTCWRVEDNSTKKLSRGQPTSGHDPLRESIQLHSGQKRKLLNQKGSVKTRPDKKAPVNVQCQNGVCTWYPEMDNNIHDKRHKGNNGNFQNQDGDSLGGSEIRPGKDGLCECHKAYRTYYNWKH